MGIHTHKYIYRHKSIYNQVLSAFGEYMDELGSTHPQKYIEVDVETYIDNHTPFNLAVAFVSLISTHTESGYTCFPPCNGNHLCSFIGFQRHFHIYYFI